MPLHGCMRGSVRLPRRFLVRSALLRSCGVRQGTVGGRAHTANADHCILATPVNKKFALLIALSLTGCGGGGGGGSNSPGAPLDAVTVSITRAATGGLLSSNPDAQVSGGQGQILPCTSPDL